MHWLRQHGARAAAIRHHPDKDPTVFFHINGRFNWCRLSDDDAISIARLALIIETVKEAAD